MQIKEGLDERITGNVLPGEGLKWRHLREEEKNREIHLKAYYRRELGTREGKSGEKQLLTGSGNISWKE